MDANSRVNNFSFDVHVSIHAPVMDAKDYYYSGVSFGVFQSTRP